MIVLSKITYFYFFIFISRLFPTEIPIVVFIKSINIVKKNRKHIILKCIFTILSLYINYIIAYINANFNANNIAKTTIT